MKTIVLKAECADSSLTFTTTSGVVTFDDQDMAVFTRNTYTFIPGEPLQINDDSDANELLLNRIFEEVI